MTWDGGSERQNGTPVYTALTALDSCALNSTTHHKLTVIEIGEKGTADTLKLF